MCSKGLIARWHRSHPRAPVQFRHFPKSRKSRDWALAPLPGYPRTLSLCALVCAAWPTRPSRVRNSRVRVARTKRPVEPGRARPFPVRLSRASSPNRAPGTARRQTPAIISTAFAGSDLLLPYHHHPPSPPSLLARSASSMLPLSLPYLRGSASRHRHVGDPEMCCHGHISGSLTGWWARR